MVQVPESVRRRFGQELRKLRVQAGLTQEDLASAVPMSQSMLSAVERGTKSTTKSQISRIDQVLNTKGKLLRRWDVLSQGDGLAEWFRGIVPVERESTEIKEYQPLVVPGLLQTPGYALASLRQGALGEPEEKLAELVQARMRRQEILSPTGGPTLRVIIEENVLRRPIGGARTMAEQVRHLAEVSYWPRAVVLVVPADAETNPGQDGPFILFTVPDKGTVVYTETRYSGSAVDASDVVDDYVRVFSELAMVALPAGSSRALLEEIARDLTP
jgi:transcriptional regulator with XRE-family HTH domain